MTSNRGRLDGPRRIVDGRRSGRVSWGPWGCTYGDQVRGLVHRLLFINKWLFHHCDLPNTAFTEEAISRMAFDVANSLQLAIMNLFRVGRWRLKWPQEPVHFSWRLFLNVWVYALIEAMR